MSILDQVALTGLNQQAVSDDFYHILDSVLVGLEGEISWPCSDEREELMGSVHSWKARDDVVPILMWDGTMQPLSEPGDANEPLFYCARKKHMGGTTNCVVIGEAELERVMWGSTDPATTVYVIS